MDNCSGISISISFSRVVPRVLRWRMSPERHGQKLIRQEQIRQLDKCFGDKGTEADMRESLIQPLNYDGAVTGTVWTLLALKPF